MIRLIYTPLGCRDSTEFLIKEAFKDRNDADYSGTLYLAPSSIKIREAQKKLHDFSVGRSLNCYIPPEFATIKMHCKKIYSFTGEKRIVQKDLIPVILSRISGKGLGFCSLIADFIKSVKQTYPNKDIESISNYFNDIFSELNIPEYIWSNVSDCLKIFGDYQLFLDRNMLIDEEDVVIQTANRLMSQAGPSFESLILDGFHDPGAAEKNVLKGLILNSKNTLISVPHCVDFKELTKEYISFIKTNFNPAEIYLNEVINNRPVPLFTYQTYAGIEEEIEGIARNIKSLFVSGKFKKLEEIIVALPMLGVYSAMVERIFSRYGIPYDISAKQPLSRTRPFIDLVSMLISVSEDYPKIRFSQLLSSQYFGKIPDELKKWMPFISIQSGIISGKKAWLESSSNGFADISLNPPEDLKTIKSGMEWVFKQMQPLEDIKTGATFKEYAALLQKLSDELGFLMPKNAYPGQYQDAKQYLFEHMSFLGSLFAGNITLSEFIDVVRHILGSSGIESESYGVKIMDLSDMQGLTAEYIYAGGLTDSNLPERPGMDYLLPESVRRRLGFLNLDKFISTQQFNFLRMVNSAKNINLSYPLTDNGDMSLPSPFLYSGCELNMDIPGIYSKEEYLTRGSEIPFSSLISEIKIHPEILSGPAVGKFNGNAVTSVTDVDAYRFCPRKFFIEGALRLKPLNIREFELEASDVGKIAHKIMERLIKEPLTDIQELSNKAYGIIEEILNEKNTDFFWKRLISDTFIEMLPDIYDNEMTLRQNDYISTDTEKTISGEPLKGMRLRGKIDRLDRVGDYVQVIDYKTGSAGLNCKQVLEGNENLQLFLYAAILHSAGYKVNRVGIYSLKDMTIKWCPPKRAKTSGKNGINDYIIASLKFFEDAVNNIRKGNFKAAPLNDYNCRNCHEYALCPYIHQ